ncbi:MAG: hypothetical protein M0Z83_03985 [Betaproteobacteria bacterium]|nr:hypothetical protein [Betaproteobacteria bacterium]
MLRWKRAHAFALFEDNFPELRAALPHSPRYVEFRMRQSLVWAVLISLLVHLFLLLWLHNPIQPLAPQANEGSQAPLDVRLNPSVPLITPEPKTTTPPQPVNQPKTPPPPRNVHRQSVPVLSVPTRQPAVHQTSRPAPPAVNNATDMSSYINMKRALNHTPQETSAPSAGTEDARSANIARNLQDNGGGGIFRITSLDDNSATFIFRGWDNATWSNPTRQSFEVKADDHTDIEHAIVRKMIAIIRLKHKTTIDWESHRLHQVVTISVRPEDNAELENFLLQEFFYDNPGR